MAALGFVNFFEEVIGAMKENQIAKSTKHATEFDGRIL